MKSVLSLTAFVTIALTAPAFSADVPEAAKVCTGCHSFEKGGAKKSGPNLFGIMGKEATVAGGGWKWTEEAMDKWLEDPVAAVKELSGKQDAKTKMTIPKIKEKEKRQAIIEFLKSLKD